MQENKSFFERKIKPVFQYVGTIGSVILSVAYIIIVIVLIQGFNPYGEPTISSGTDVPQPSTPSIDYTLIFAIVTAIIGFIIMQFLKIQGISFAKNLPDNQKILNEYYQILVNKKNKKKKLHSLTYFWITSIGKDFLLKCITLIISTIGIVWIIFEGSKDYSMLLLAFVNLLMFICFGLVSLVKAYDFYNEQHINFIKEKINEENNKQNMDVPETVCELEIPDQLSDTIYAN